MNILELLKNKDTFITIVLAYIAFCVLLLCASVLLLVWQFAVVAGILVFAGTILAIIVGESYHNKY